MMHVLLGVRLGVTLALARVVQSETLSYDEQSAMQQVEWTGAAYCCGTLGSGCEDWSCPSCHGEMDTVVIADTAHNVNGFVGYSAELNTIVVSFAGTDPLSLRNWIDDVRTLKEPFQGYGSDTATTNCWGVCEVHKGFYESYLSVAFDVRAAVSSFWAAAANGTGVLPQVVATGHSLGAALAQHAAIDIASSAEVSEKALSVGQAVPPVLMSSLYNFGQPRTGNAAFSNYSALLLGSANFRITHHKDPVPHVPFQDWGYKHEPREVFYEAEVFKAGGYLVCSGNENASCSDQYLLDENVPDHLTYMGFDFTENYLRCKL